MPICGGTIWTGWLGSAAGEPLAPAPAAAAAPPFFLPMRMPMKMAAMMRATPATEPTVAPTMTPTFGPEPPLSSGSLVWVERVPVVVVRLFSAVDVPSSVVVDSSDVVAGGR